MEDDFDVMEDDKKIVVSLLTRAVLIHLNVLKWLGIDVVSRLQDNLQPREDDLLTTEDDLQTKEDDLQTKKDDLDITEDDLDITEDEWNLVFPFN